MTLIRRDTKSIAIFGLKMIAIWHVAYTIFVFFRNYGIDESIRYQEVAHIDHLTEFTTVLLVSVLTGIFYTALEIFFDRSYFQKIAFGKVIVIKTILYFIMMRIVFFFGSICFAWMEGQTIDKEMITTAMMSKTFWALLFYFLLVSAVISFVLQVSQKFGPGMLWNFIIGKYHKPLEEDRIFLFVDLHSSTAHAEQLGHIKYSRLLQDCFFDLTTVVTEHRVDVYQYVGDEAVLSWKKETGISNNRCLHAYFDFQKILDDRKEYYMENYGLQPYFKAGLHMGKVTVAEVGVVKKEIAYHGDVLNTTARIQGECNKFGQSLLVSEEIINNISFGQHFNSKLMDSPLLKGKKKKVNIYGVQLVPAL